MNRTFLHVLNLTIAVGLAAVVVVVNRPWEVWTLDIDFVWAVAASLVLEAALIAVWAQRHSLVLGAVGADVPARDLGWIVTFSGTANSLTPAASGEVARAWLLNRNFGVPYEQAAAAIFFERFFILGFMALTALGFGLIAGGSSIWLVLGAAVLIVLYIVATPWLAAPLRRRLQPPTDAGRIRKLVTSAITGGLESWSDRRVALLTAAWSAAAFAVIAAVFWLSSLVSGLEIDGFAVWALVGGATVVGVLSALPFGLGAAELSAVGIGALLGLEARNVAAAFVVYRVLFTLPIALVGSVAYARLMAARKPQAP